MLILPDPKPAVVTEVTELRKQNSNLHTLGYEPSELPIARHSAILFRQESDDALVN